MATEKTRRSALWAGAAGVCLAGLMSLPLWASEGPALGDSEGESDALGLLEAAWVLGQAPPEAVEAGDPIVLTLGYQFYGGGFRVAEMDLETLLSPDGYDLSAQLRTVGLANLLFPGEARLRGYGLTESEEDARAYAYVIQSRSGERSVAIVGSEEGGYESAVEPHREPDRELEEGRTQGTVDPLGAVAVGIFQAAAAPCTDGMEVFDGRKVLEVEFSDVEAEWVESRLGMFEGEAMRCQIGYRAVAGVDPAEESREKRPAITIWLARMEGVLSDGGDILVPVRVQARISHFDAVVHLTTMRVNGVALADWRG